MQGGSEDSPYSTVFDPLLDLILQFIADYWPLILAAIVVIAAWEQLRQRYRF